MKLYFSVSFQLEYSSRESVGPCIAVHFQDHKNNISLPIGKVIQLHCYFVF